MMAVVFDLDGTLIDSAPDLQAAANRMLAELGRDPVTLAQTTSFIGNGVAKLVERCLLATGDDDIRPVFEAAHGRFKTIYEAAPAALTRPFDGVAQALIDLRSLGIQLGVCTNKPQDLADTILRQLALAQYFTAIVGGGPLRPLKPDPAPLLACFKRLGVSQEQRLYVGDSETDQATSHAARIPFALFSKGYRTRPIEEFDASALVFDRFADLTSYVRASNA